MTYRRSDFASGLRAQLGAGYDVERIAKWAYLESLDSRNLEEGLDELILQVVAMAEGPEFEMTEEELILLCEELEKGKQSEQPDPG